MVTLKEEKCRERFFGAVKYIWGLRASGEEVKITPVTKKFHINSSYSTILSEITGEEKDVEGLCEDLLRKAKEYNRVCAKNRNAREKEKTEAPTDLFNPETLRDAAEKLLEHKIETPQEVDIDRLRDKIRQEIYDELDNRDKEYAKARRYNVAFGVLTSLVPTRHKDRPDEIAKRAVRIADEFLEELNKTE